MKVESPSESAFPCLELFQSVATLYAEAGYAVIITVKLLQCSTAGHVEALHVVVTAPHNLKLRQPMNVKAFYAVVATVELLDGRQVPYAFQRLYAHVLNVYSLNGRDFRITEYPVSVRVKVKQ